MATVSYKCGTEWQCERHKGSGIMTGLTDKWCFLALGLSQMQFGKFFHAITVSSYMMHLGLCQQEDNGSAKDNNHEPKPCLSFTTYGVTGILILTTKTGLMQ